MTLPIDIFKIDSEGPRWLQAAASIEEAKAHITQAAGTAAGEYLIMNQLTGNKTIMKVSCEVDGVAIAPMNGRADSSAASRLSSAWSAEG